MSQRDLVAELRAATTPAPPELRVRIRAIAAAAPDAPRRRIHLRRAFALGVPLAAAIAAAVVLGWPSTPKQQAADRGGLQTATGVQHGASTFGTPQRETAPSAKAATGAAPGPLPPPSRTRTQQYGADLSLRVPTSAAVASAVTRAVRIANSLGGYAAAVHVDRTATRGSATLTLRVPQRHVQDAVARLAALGTVTHERVDVQDLQGGLDATGRTIARLQRELKVLRAHTETADVVQRIAQLTAQIERLQRGEASTVRSATYARIGLSLSTPPPAPHHARRWPWYAAGGAALLVLLLAGVAWRVVRRRREAALLSRP